MHKVLKFFFWLFEGQLEKAGTEIVKHTLIKKLHWYNLIANMDDLI